jgi:hypothetical protein
MVIGDVAPDVVIPLGDDTAVNVVIFEPLLFVGAVNDTSTAPETSVADPMVGAFATAGV